MNEIEKALRKKIKKQIPTQAFVGKVLKVDENKFTCNVMPIDSDAEIFAVRLKPTIDTIKKGIIAIPADGSYVIVGLLNNNENSAFIIWCSNIKKYYIIGDGGNSIEFKDDGTILLNGDTFGGLIKINDLVQRLNAIETAFNNHLVLYSAHIHTGGTMSGSTGTTAPDTSNVLTQTVVSQIENTTVKHG